MAGAQAIVEERVVDGLLATLQSLKVAGLRVEDPRQLWCADWLLAVHQMSSCTNPRLQAVKAQNSLAKMKSLLKGLDALRKSVEDTIELVTLDSAAAVREHGFSLLPDEVLARIFELTYEDCRKHFLVHAVLRSTHILGKVCRRFRQIVNHTPSLWQDCSTMMKPEFLKHAFEHQPHPSIIIDEAISLARTGTASKVVETLDRLPPPSEWRELLVQYTEHDTAREIFDYIRTKSGGELSRMRNLRINRTRNMGHEEEDEPTSEISAECNLLLANLDAPMLERVTLQSIIPSNIFVFPDTITEFSLLLVGLPLRWDIYALRRLLAHLSCLETLNLKLMGARSFLEPTEPGPAPVQLLSLSSLNLNISYGTEDTFLKNVVDMLDVPALSKLDVSLQFDSNNLEEIYPVKWLDAIFRASPSSIRTFPYVRKFNLSVNDRPWSLPYESVFRSIPRVLDLQLELPNCADINFHRLSTDFRCFGELQTLHLKNCTEVDSAVDHVERTLSFDASSSSGSSIKEFKVEKCYKLLNKRTSLERLLGERFIWID